MWTAKFLNKSQNKFCQALLKPWGGLTPFGISIHIGYEVPFEVPLLRDICTYAKKLWVIVLATSAFCLVAECQKYSLENRRLGLRVTLVKGILNTRFLLTSGIV